MKDSEKLDLILKKVTALDQKVTALEKDMSEVKADIKNLHIEVSFFFDEIERVHSILEMHKADKSVHTA